MCDYVAIQMKCGNPLNNRVVEKVCKMCDVHDMIDLWGECTDFCARITKVTVYVFPGEVTPCKKFEFLITLSSKAANMIKTYIDTFAEGSVNQIDIDWRMGQR
jgi:hypothetical protein